MIDVVPILAHFFPAALGQVGDICPKCKTARPLLIYRARRGFVPPIVEEQLAATGHTAKCFECGAKFKYDIRRARRLVAVEAWPLDELCEATNSVFAGVIREDSEALAVEPPDRWARLLEPFLYAEVHLSELKRSGRSKWMWGAYCLSVSVMLGAILFQVKNASMTGGFRHFLVWVGVFCASGLVAAGIATLENHMLAPRRVEHWISDRIAPLKPDHEEVEALLDWLDTTGLQTSRVISFDRLERLLACQLEGESTVV
jgi:hypothetical protein